MYRGTKELEKSIVRKLVCKIGKQENNFSAGQNFHMYETDS